MRAKTNIIWVVEEKINGTWSPVNMAFSREEARGYQDDYKHTYKNPSRVVKYFSNNQAE